MSYQLRQVKILRRIDRGNEDEWIGRNFHFMGEIDEFIEQLDFDIFQIHLLKKGDEEDKQ